MSEIEEILKEKLKNNEPLIRKIILSYLEKCDLCWKYEDIYFRHYPNKKQCCFLCFEKWIKMDFKFF